MLAEFAIVVVVLWLLLAALLEFGRMLAVGQMLQNAARAAARSLALSEQLGAESSLAAALASPWGRQELFDPEWLVLDFAALAACGRVPAGDVRAFEDFVAELPLVNRMLRPAMIPDRVTDSGRERRDLLRYPGALLRRLDAPVDPCASPYTVGIPQTTGDSLRWLPVIEEAGGADHGFALSQGGVAAVRIHYPYAAVAWSATNDPERRLGALIRADAAVVPVNPAEAGPGGGLRGSPIEALDDEVGPYAGRYGLGRQLLPLPDVRASGVRPYARILVGQAAFPREVVAPWPP